MAWRMEAMCSDCPFAKSGAGLRLRKSLRPGRWLEILRSLRADQSFPCHKTTDETGDGSNLACAGGLEWQHERGLSSNFERVMERIWHVFERAK